MELLPDTRGSFVLGTAVAKVIYSPAARAWGWFAFAEVNPPNMEEIKNVVAVHSALKAYGFKAEVDNLDGFRPLSEFIGIKIPKELEETIVVESEVRGLRG